MPGATTQERILATAGAAVASRRSRADVARELVEEIRDLVPYDAMQVGIVDPFTGGHATLVNAGYSQRVVDYVDGEYTLRDRAFGELVRDRRPLRMCDVAFDYRSSYSYVEYWGPEGYGDGMTTPLYGADGRYVGFANISTEAEGHLTDEVRDFMELLSGVFGAAVDPLADLASWLAEESGSRRVVVRADGTVMEREAEGGADIAVDPAVVVDAADAMARSTLNARTGLVADREGRLVQMQMLRARSERLSQEPLVLVTLRDADQPFGLTQRETVVLRHLVDGGSNREIALSLGIAPRTVATHVEHLLQKLGAETRTGAAARAVEHGLMRLDVRPGA